MSENTKKKRPSYNEDAVKVLEEKYGVSNYFIRASIRGDRHSLTSNSIRKDYQEMTGAMIEALKQVTNKDK